MLSQGWRANRQPESPPLEPRRDSPVRTTIAQWRECFYFVPYAPLLSGLAGPRPAAAELAGLHRLPLLALAALIERVDDPHLLDRVGDRIGPGLLLADRLGKGLGLQRVLVARRDGDGLDAAAAQILAAVLEDAAGM